MRSCPGSCRCSSRSGCAPTSRRSCSGCRSSSSEAIARVLILADDLSGAADAAAAFVGRARRIAVALGDGRRPRGDVVAVDLDTRSRSAPAAARRVRAAFGRRSAKRAGILFKKIDSGLRGHVLAELLAARAAIGPRRPVIVAPAFPDQGRVVRCGRVYVRGAPVMQPVGVALAKARFVLADAASDADLDAIARRGLAMRPRPLFAGSAGLARALARTLPPARGDRAVVDARPVVTVVGSASPVSKRQAKRLEAHREARAGHVLLALGPTRRGAALDGRQARKLARTVAAIAPRAHYVLTGGETARAVLAALGVRAFRVLGEIEPGVPFGVTPAGALVCTKAGAFGAPDTLISSVERLKREMAR